MDKILERLKTEFSSEESRYAYADSFANAFLTAQIKALREDRGLTQEELAELVGTQQSGISRWQNSGYSSCKVDTLRKFAKAYGVRLRITFEEFGSLPEDVRGFTEKRLAPPKFEDDPAFKEPAKEEVSEKKSVVGSVQANKLQRAAGGLPTTGIRDVTAQTFVASYGPVPCTLQQMAGQGSAYAVGSGTIDSVISSSTDAGLVTVMPFAEPRMQVMQKSSLATIVEPKTASVVETRKMHPARELRGGRSKNTRRGRYGRTTQRVA